ncbi:hypothetical protein [Clostridium sp.]|uniref:DUF7222 domain-containing protein n=1 Tax=Clostridium sp. TaxID=1506 RepID=UPI0025BDB67E|nr:hypothetical protein [Clostridium sp.]
MKKFSKKSLNELKNMEGFNDRLSKRVINDLLATGLSTEELKDHINYIIKYGCYMKNINAINYYMDTIRFFNTYRKEILNLVNKEVDSIIDNKSQKRFTKEEKKELSWFAYKEIVRRIDIKYF